jgi:acetyl esterase/lipase
MLKKPLMSSVFDFFEASRAAANGKTPFDDEIKVVKDVVYKTVDGKDLVMDFYIPSKPAGEKTPVVFDIPGGGWMIHNRQRRDGYAKLFAVMGAFVAVIDHRLCPEVFFPEDLKDVSDALDFLLNVKDEYNLDLDNVTVTGDSSGGHLAACLGCASSDEGYRQKLGLAPLKVKVSKLIMISGSFSFEIMYRIPLTHTLIVRYFSGQRSRSSFRKWQYYKESIPYNYINKDFPESFNSGGSQDILCAGEAKRMADCLTRAGVKNEYVIGTKPYSNGHCDILRIPFPAARELMTRLFKWYCDKQSEKGVDMTSGFSRIEKFFENYKDALDKKVAC